MSDGQEVPEEFPKKKYITIAKIICHGCMVMIEDVIVGEEGWLFCGTCGTGVMKIETICMGEGEL